MFLTLVESLAVMLTEKITSLPVGLGLIRNLLYSFKVDLRTEFFFFKLSPQQRILSKNVPNITKAVPSTNVASMFVNSGDCTDDKEQNKDSRSCRFVICFSSGSPILCVLNSMLLFSLQYCFFYF